MKTIANSTTSINSGTVEEPVSMTYFDLIKLVANYPSPEGFNIEQIRQRLIIWGAVDTAKDMPTVDLENADFVALKEIINKFKWRYIHKDILSFVDYMNSL